MLYEYKCPECGYQALSRERGDVHLFACGECLVLRMFKRVWSVSLPRPLHPYYDEGLSSTVMSNSDYAKKLKVAGDKYTERTGTEVNYQPISPDEVKAKVTDDGMKETHDRQVKLGMREATGKIVK